jgi:hypothetical protein
MRTGSPAYTSEAWDAEVMPRVKNGELFDITLQLPERPLTAGQVFAGVLMDVRTENMYECIGVISVMSQKGYVSVREVSVKEIEGRLPNGEVLNISIPVPEHITKPPRG